VQQHLTELRCAGRPSCRLEGHRPLNERLQRGTDLRRELADRTGLKDAARLFGRVFAGQERPCQLAQGIDVAARIGLPLPILLRRAVSLCAQTHGVLRDAALEETSDAKVDQLECPVGLHHDVGRLQIAEDHWWLLVVQVLQDVAELDQPAPNLCLWNTPTPPLHRCQRLAVDVFHHQEKPPVFGERVIDRGQMGMAQSAEDSSFLQEEPPRLLDSLGICPVDRHQLFQRQPLVQLDMARFVDAAHAALRNQALDAVSPADDGAWHQWHPLRHRRSSRSITRHTMQRSSTTGIPIGPGIDRRLTRCSIFSHPVVYW